MDPIVATETLVAEARTMLGLVGTPTGFVTGTLLATSNAAIARNRSRLDRRTTAVALATSVMACAMAGVLTIVMTPIALRSVTAVGSVEGVLILYWLGYITAIGVTAYAGYVVWKAAGDIGRLARVRARRGSGAVS